MKKNPYTPSHDWMFDVGLDNDGKITVDAWASAIPDIRFKALNREQLLNLRAEINGALRKYPKPPGVK